MLRRGGENFYWMGKRSATTETPEQINLILKKMSGERFVCAVQYFDQQEEQKGDNPDHGGTMTIVKSVSEISNK